MFYHFVAQYGGDSFQPLTFSPMGAKPVVKMGYEPVGIMFVYECDTCMSSKGKVLYIGLNLGI